MASTKDAYYFPHFSNARQDKKLRRVRKELGVEGYGIYFMILETLRDQEDFSYTVDDIDLLADDFGTSEQKIRTVIANYGLFAFSEDGKMFTSERFIQYMQPYLEKRERARAAALKRWGYANADANAYANALPEQCKESKVNKSKVKESRAPRADAHIEGFPINQTTHDKLVEEYGISTILHYYTTISDYVASKGKKDYADYSATARQWIKRDIEQGKGPKKKTKPKPMDEIELAIYNKQMEER